MRFCLNSFNNKPDVVAHIEGKTRELGFEMASTPETGALLRLLASTKPNGKFLEIGTGTGLSAAWILDGMDQSSTLISVDSDSNVQAVAKSIFRNEKRIEFVTENGIDYLKRQSPKMFDLIFADAIPGKYEYLVETLELLKNGGIYIVDDMLPQPDWPDDHYPFANQALTNLKNLKGVNSVGLHWSTGLIILTKKE